MRRAFTAFLVVQKGFRKGSRILVHLILEGFRDIILEKIADRREIKSAWLTKVIFSGELVHGSTSGQSAHSIVFP